MKKATFTIILAAIAAASLTGCNNSENATQSDTSIVVEETNANAEAEIESTTLSTNGSTYDTGLFTVTIPEGWKEFTQTGMEKDSDGNYMTDPSSLVICKQEESESGLINYMPGVQVYYMEGYDIDDEMEYCKNGFDDVTDLDVTINGKTYPAFECVNDLSDSELFDGEDAVYIDDYVFVPVNDQDFFKIVIPVQEPNADCVTLEDPGVQTIISTVEPD